MSIFLSFYGDVTCFDLSENSLRIAAKNAKNLKREIKFIQTDITQKKDRGIFDYIFCIGILHHIPEVEKALSSIKAMMHENSLAIISIYNYYAMFHHDKIKRRFFQVPEEKNIAKKIDDDFHVYEKFYTRNSAKKLLKENGFKILGEWRKIPEFIRLLTGKGRMMTFLVKKIV